MVVLDAVQGMNIMLRDPVLLIFMTTFVALIATSMARSGEQIDKHLIRKYIKITLFATGLMLMLLWGLSSLLVAAGYLKTYLPQEMQYLVWTAFVLIIFDFFLYISK